MHSYQDDTTWATPSQHMEPNVGMSQGGVAGKDVKELYLYYRALFAEMMGNEMSGEQLAKMAMEHALKDV